MLIDQRHVDKMFLGIEKKKILWKDYYVETVSKVRINLNLILT